MQNSSERPLVVSGPSGVGKTSLLKRLLDEFPDEFAFCTSHTTRKPRLGETDGVQYHFVSRERFAELVEDGQFLESTEFCGNSYGTSFKSLKEASEGGRRCVLEVEAAGVRQIKSSKLDATFLFLAPPSLSLLRRWLQERGTEDDSMIQTRLDVGINEMRLAHGGDMHDVVLVNHDMDCTYENLKRVASGESIVGDILPDLGLFLEQERLHVMVA